jgi:hypothetical protein
VSPCDRDLDPSGDTIWWFLLKEEQLIRLETEQVQWDYTFGLEKALNAAKARKIEIEKRQTE